MITRYLTILLALTLSACGSGGGGGAPATSTSPTTTFPFASAVSAFMQASHNYNLSAVSGADTYSLQINFTPGTQQQLFEGHLSSTMAESIIIKKNGVVALTYSDTGYFDVSPYKDWGDIASDGSYTVAAGQQALPSNASVGQSGSFETTTTYTNSTKTSIASTDTEVWSLESDTAATAWVCINSTTTYTNGSPTVSGGECFKADQSGNVSAMKFSIYVSGQSLTFQ